MKIKIILLLSIITLFFVSGCDEPFTKKLFESTYGKNCQEYLFEVKLSDNPCEFECKKRCYEKGYDFKEASESKIVIKEERSEGILNKQSAEMEAEGYNCGCSCITCEK